MKKEDQPIVAQKIDRDGIRHFVDTCNHRMKPEDKLQAHSDGDIFKMARRIYDDNLKELHIRITNLHEAYWWLIEYRDELKKQAVVV